MKDVTDKNVWAAAWYPQKIYELDYKWYIDWKFIGDKHFSEPFYRDTLGRISAETNQQITSPIEILRIPGNVSFEEIGPSAFIFHISRCGSTLLTQMLSRIPENIVISEAPVIDQLITSNLHQKRKEQYLQALIQLLCKKRFPEERRSFIKFDAWHLFCLDEIRNVFPDVPILILYRNPNEVLLSHAQIRGKHLVPGFFDETVIGIDREDYANLDRYAAKVLQIYFEKILQYSSQQGIFLLNYIELPGMVWSLFNRYMQIKWPAEKIEKMKSQARYYSKDKTQNFDGDNWDKTDLSLPNDLALLNSLYKKLEAYRRQQRG